MQVSGEPNVTFLYENVLHSKNLQVYILTRNMIVFCIMYDTQGYLGIQWILSYTIPTAWTRQSLNHRTLLDSLCLPEEIAGLF